MYARTLVFFVTKIEIVREKSSLPHGRKFLRFTLDAPKDHETTKDNRQKGRRCWDVFKRPSFRVVWIELGINTVLVFLFLPFLLIFIVLSMLLLVTFLFF